jgi:hypothetical protein
MQNSSHKHPLLRFFKEIRIFLVLFVAVMGFMIVFTNLNLFVASFRNLFDNSIQKIQDIRKQDVYANKDISSALQLSEEQQLEIQKLIASYQSGGALVRGAADSPQTLLQQKLAEYPFVFNTLPPISKVLIPSI